jgi:hypothetical protein
MSKPTIDEIVDSLHEDCSVNCSHTLTDDDWLKVALRTLIDEALERVIGEDSVAQDFTFGKTKAEARYENNLRAEQRQRKATVLDELFGEEKE